MKNYLTEAKWALIFTAMYLFWILLEKVSGFHSSRIQHQQFTTTLILLPSLLIYILALWDKKKNLFRNSMSYKQSFISGMVLTLFIVLLSPISQLIVSTLITPDYFKNITEYTVSKGILTREEALNQFNTTNYIITGIIGGLFTGLVFTSIISIFTKTKQQVIS